MKITSSYAMKLTGDLKALENSIRIYRDALHFVIPIVHTHWDELVDFEYTKQRMTYTEKLIHTTAKSQARYNFDGKFPKFPSYLHKGSEKARGFNPGMNQADGMFKYTYFK